MFAYFLFLIFLFSYGMIWDRLSISQKRLSVFVLIWWITFFIGFKYDVGTDSPNYLLFYNKVYYAKQYYDEVFLKIPEIAFSLVNYLAVDLELGTLLVYCICGLIIAFGTVKAAINFRINPFYFVAFTFPFHIVMMSMSGIRQGVAESLVILAISYLYLNKKKNFVYLILAALTFHVSALLFLGLYFIDSKKRYLTLVTIILAPIVIMFSNESYGHYIESSMFNQGIFLRGGFLAGILTITYLYHYQSKRIDIGISNRLMYFNYLSLPLIIITGMLSTTLGDRISYYFILIAVAVFLKLGQRINLQQKQVFISISSFFCFLALFVFLNFGNHGKNYLYDNYVFRLILNGEFPVIDSAVKVRGNN